MNQIVVDSKLIYVGKCPVPKCEHRDFTGDTVYEVLEAIKAHMINNLADPNHSDIYEMEDWAIPGP